jgi:hypothetical protein
MRPRLYLVGLDLSRKDIKIERGGGIGEVGKRAVIFTECLATDLEPVRKYKALVGSSIVAHGPRTNR